jgi:hypothetical protein
MEMAETDYPRLPRTLANHIETGRLVLTFVLKMALVIALNSGSISGEVI